jgi:hypothetical protein
LTKPEKVTQVKDRTNNNTSAQEPDTTAIFEQQRVQNVTLLFYNFLVAFNIA